MYLTQLLVPLPGGRKTRASRSAFGDVVVELAARYGGVTSYVQSPAEGLWLNRGHRERDKVIIIEVMSKSRDLSWWKKYRRALEKRFDQEYLIVRTLVVSMN